MTTHLIYITPQNIKVLADIEAGLLFRAWSHESLRRHSVGVFFPDFFRQNFQRTPGFCSRRLKSGVKKYTTLSVSGHTMRPIGGCYGLPASEDKDGGRPCPPCRRLLLVVIFF